MSVTTTTTFFSTSATAVRYYWIKAGSRASLSRATIKKCFRNLSKRRLLGRSKRNGRDKELQIWKNCGDKRRSKERPMRNWWRGSSQERLKISKQNRMLSCLVLRLTRARLHPRRSSYSRSQHLNRVTTICTTDHHLRVSQQWETIKAQRPKNWLKKMTHQTTYPKNRWVSK